MKPVSIAPQTVPRADVRRLDGGVHEPTQVQQVAVRPVPSPIVVPRQIDPPAPTDPRRVS